MRILRAKVSPSLAGAPNRTRTYGVQNPVFTRCSFSSPNLAQLIQVIAEGTAKRCSDFGDGSVVKLLDEHERTMAFAEVALGQIKSLGQTAVARKYEIWFVYATSYTA